MAVDDEVSIPAQGQNQNHSQSVYGFDDVFYSAASASYNLSGSSIEVQDEEMELGRDLGHLSKESIPDRLTTIEEPRRKSITDDDAMQHIDPHGLIAFDSPSRFPSGILRSNPALSRADGPSLLDVDIMASPSSMAKYSQRDFDGLKAEFERRAEKQAEFMQFEIQALQERYDASLQANHELRILMAEYENTMAHILGTLMILL